MERSEFVKGASTSALAGAIGALLIVCAADVSAQFSGFQLDISEPRPDLVVPNRQRAIQVKGRAAIIGGVRKLDLFLVLDTSKSLRGTDPNDHRTAGAVGLVKSLAWTDAHIGVVDFDRKTRLVSPLAGDRSAVLSAVRGLDQKGSSDLGAGIRMALDGFEQSGRPGSQRLMLVFSDGKLKKGVRQALEEARDAGVSVSTVLFGASKMGAATLRELADGTGGSFVAVSDPAELPDAFMNLRTTGVERVELRVNGSEPVEAQLTSGGNFQAEVPLERGENRIVARAVGFDGREKEQTVAVTVRSPGCAELHVLAERDGKPALSLSNRGVEIVVDASGSMWGRMDGRTKIEIAKEILDGALEWLPPDLNLSLRAYGHQYDRKERNCEDSELLVPPGSGNRGDIRKAIASLRPKGWTPIGYSLARISADFGGFVGERAVVLVTDGLESCDGDPAAEARSLQQDGSVPVHVIGFGLGGQGEDLTSLRAIAEASGGKFITAGSASELRRALGTTVGTSFRVQRGEETVARGTLGADDRVMLPAGDYLLQLDSAPPHQLPVRLASEEGLTLVLRREGQGVSDTASRAPIGYVGCDESGPEREDGAQAASGAQ